MPCSDRAYRDALSELEQFTSPARVLDMGVRVYVVRQDIPNGVEVIPGLAPVTPIDSFELGGLWDTFHRRYVGPSVKPKIWYCAEYVAELIRHADTLPPKILVEAGFGAGKTQGILSSWLCARALEYAPLAGHQGIELLGTSPTDRRLEEYVDAVAAKLRPTWYDYNVKSHVFRLHTGVRLRLLGTAKRSAAEGSRVQGFNSAAAGCDEGQDHFPDELENIYARGRRAPKGIYKMLATATPKICSKWREARRKMLASGEWHHLRVDARTNVMVWPKFWEDQRTLYTKQQFARCVEGKDVGPERQLYFSWDRDKNLRPIPMLGARDVTRQVLAKYGVNRTILCGHDPGSRYDVTTCLKAFELPGVANHVWWVVSSVTTERTTTEQHIAVLLAHLRERWGCDRIDAKGKPIEDSDRAHVRIDPYGQQNSKPHLTIHQMFRAHGLDARSAAYSGGRSTGVVHVEAGIELVNRLLCDAAGNVRLCVACDEHGKPVAPELVDAFEMAERDIAERAEAEKKGSDEDRSHWPASVRYALWALERRPETVTEGARHYGP